MTFSEMIDVVLKFEGGYVNDPKDPGGETNFGISKRQYPNLDIKNLTKDQAKQIYFRDYYLKYDIDKLPPALQLMALDTAVLQGPTFMKATVKPEWFPDPIMSLLPFAEARRLRFAANANWNLYGKGWMRRLIAVAMLSVLDYHLLRRITP